MKYLRQILQKLWQHKILFSAAFLCLSLVFTSIVVAQTYSDDLDQFAQEITSGEMHLGSWTAGPDGVLDNLVQGTSVRLFGGKSNNGLASIGVNGFIALGIQSMYDTPPTSAVYYAQNVLNNIGPSKAYAQTYGFQALNPVLELWRIFRNLSYLLFVVLFLIFGFLILFRTKLNPQTIISIENSLPKIIVGLLIITFSYAIAGLMIDVATVVTRTFVYLFWDPYFLLNTAGNEPQFLTNIEQTNNIFNLAGTFINNEVIGGITDAIKSSVQVSFPDIDVGILEVSARLFGLIFGIAAISAMFRTFFALLTSYVNIIISTIFSPLQLLGSLLPGGGNIGDWIKNLFSNVFVFPLTFILLIMAAIIERFGEPLTAPTGGPNVSPEPWEVYFTGQENNLFRWSPIPLGLYGGAIISKLIAFGIILMLPSIPKMIKEALQSKPEGPSPFDTVKGVAARLPLIGQFVS